MATNLCKVKRYTKDLHKNYPRSPHEKLGGYVIAARCVDKCRAFLPGVNDEYNYWPCSLASQWFVFTGITLDQFKDVVATGATDVESGEWIVGRSQVKNADDVLKWNNKLGDMRLSEMSVQAQQFLEEYIPKVVPKDRPVYVWFDVYDLEESDCKQSGRDIDLQRKETNDESACNERRRDQGTRRSLSGRVPPYGR